MSSSGRLSALFGRHAKAVAPAAAGVGAGPLLTVGHLTLHSRPFLTAAQLRAVLAVAIVVLGVLIAADVAAYETTQLVTHVTAVNWYVETQLLSTTAGFSVHGPRTFMLTITCDFICYNFNAAQVNAPFQLVGFSVVNEATQYTNVTIHAPAGSYTGPLTITLGVP